MSAELKCSIKLLAYVGEKYCLMKKKSHLCGDTTLEDISQNVSSESKIELRWDNETDNLGQFKAAYFTLFTTSNYFP